MFVPSSRYPTCSGRAPAMASWVPPYPPVNSRPVARLTTTPGCSVASWRKLRPLSGSSAICSRVTTPPAALAVVSSSARVSLTSTRSATAAGASVKSTRTSWPIWTSTSATTGAKPSRVAVTRYRPGWRSSTRYAPRSDVVTPRATPVSSFITVTTAPGVLEAELSSTRPEMLPVVDCPATGRASAATSRTPDPPPVHVRCSSNPLRGTWIRC